MQPRKLIRLGNSSFAIALPKDWIDKSGLKKGDDVFIIPDTTGGLIIKSDYKKVNGDREITIETSNKHEKEISRELIAAYVNGNTSFRINTSSEKELAHVKKILEDLPGIEIMKKETGQIIAKDLIDINTISIDGIIRRIDNTIRSMLEDIEIFIKSEKITSKDIEALNEADEDVNKFYFMLWKFTLLGLENPAVLNTLKIDYSSLVHTWWVGMSLEKTGDELKRMLRTFAKEKPDKKDFAAVLNLLQILKKNYIDILNAYHKKDKINGLELAKKRVDFFDKCRSIENSKSVATHEICEKMKDIQNNLHYVTKSVVYFIK